MKTLLAAIAGDLLGSSYEFDNYRGCPDDLPFFPDDAFATDDTVLTCAVANALLTARLTDGTIDERKFSLALPDSLRRFALRHPEAGYGDRFWNWVKRPGAPAYGSLGNGSAMRVLPCALVTDNLEAASRLARLSPPSTRFFVFAKALTAENASKPNGMAASEP